MSSTSPTIPPSLSKQLATNNTNGNTTNATSSKRVPPEAAEAISECLRLFVREAHRRASIEAECDDEGEFRALNESGQQTNNDGNSSTPIHAHHVTRIAGDLLMDFS